MISITADCPNGHFPGFKFTAGELRELLDEGRLRFWCYHCDTYFPPPLGAIVNLRKQVAMAEILGGKPQLGLGR